MTPLVEGGAPFMSRRSMAVCAASGLLVFFGGVGAAATESILDVANDCWTFDPASLAWARVRETSPWPSARRCVGFTAWNGRLHLWGGSGIETVGRDTRYTFLNDWWALDIASQRWERLRESDDHRSAPAPGIHGGYPAPRYTPVFAAVGTSLFLFGGYTEDLLGKRKLNDAWVYQSERWTEIPRIGREGYVAPAAWPGPRYGCMSVATPGAVLVCGGFSEEGDHNDLWRFSVETCCWELLCGDNGAENSPPPRYSAACALHERRLYLFGGRSRRHPKSNYNDLWAFDLDRRAWECLTPNRSPHRYDAGAPYPAYHAKASATTLDGYWYVWGGEGLRGHVSDFWRFAFSGQRWEQIQAGRHDDPVFW